MAATPEDNINDDGVEEVNEEQFIAEGIERYEQSVAQKSNVGVVLSIALRNLLREHDLTKVIEQADGPLEIEDPEAIEDALFAAFSSAKVVSKKDHDTEPVHKYDITHSVLHQYPKPYDSDGGWDDLDPLTRQAILAAVAFFWRKATSQQQQYGAKFQRRVRKELGKDYVLVRMGDSLYVTSEPRFVKTEVFQPPMDKAEVSTIKAAEMIGKFSKGNPALSKVGKQVVKASANRIGTKAVAAFMLTNGNENDAADNGDDDS